MGQGSTTDRTESGQNVGKVDGIQIYHWDLLGRENNVFIYFYFFAIRGREL